MFKVLSYDKSGFMFCYFTTTSRKEAEMYMQMDLYGVKHVLEVSN